MNIYLEALDKASVWEREKVLLPDIVEAYRHLWHLQGEVRARFAIPEPPLSQATMAERLAQGVPALSFSDLSLDWERVQKLATDVLDLLERLSPQTEPHGDIRDTIASADHFKTAAEAWYAGTEFGEAVQTGEDAESLAFLVWASMQPFLSAYSEALLPAIDLESWRRGYCPVCGGKPDFAFLGRERGARWLVCPRCQTSWPFQRLECPFCRTTDQRGGTFG